MEGCPTRELATGFYYGTPSENEQLFGARRKIPSTSLSLQWFLMMQHKRRNYSSTERD